MNEIQIIEDEQGFLILGDNAEIDHLLENKNLDSRAIKKQTLQSAGKGAGLLADAMSQSGRWVKMTEESAKLVKQYGSTGTGVIRRSNGKIVQYIKFEDLSKVKSLANPDMLTGIAGMMTQMALEQAIEEITDYLKSIDKKIDDLLQDQKDQSIANLVGVAHMVNETMMIRDQVGTVSETAWSKIAGCPQDVARAQSYALLKIEGLAKKLRETHDAAEAEKVAKQLYADATEWMSILGNAVQLQDKLYVLELDRVMAEEPQNVSQHREGIIAARKRRLKDIETKLLQLNTSIEQSANAIRKQKVFHPLSVTNALKMLDTSTEQIARFALSIGVESERVTIAMAPRWADAAGQLISDGARQLESGAKQFGENALNLGVATGQTISAGTQQLGSEALRLGGEAGQALGKGAAAVSEGAGAAIKNIGGGVEDLSKKLGGLFKR
ncbi:hypothetical protein [Bifidobacterium oedipodis]|uniref:Uncharacterized protein n=1 Tax=Bifidobacterium oedipodis TaxID=2675322 RepID=A0A7Y0EPW6_9BIFI|nr:hypothetical protein [Bifidobacterium sp. DSM 109957]NMM94266.1 hypothetical protein [Bifidobacterium sp. DSM 109957]